MSEHTIIWIDGDQCPGEIEVALADLARRTEQAVFFVTSHDGMCAKRHDDPDLPPTFYVEKVEPGDDAVDKWICRRLSIGDIVVTGDGKFAKIVQRRPARVISPVTVDEAGPRPRRAARFMLHLERMLADAT